MVLFLNEDNVKSILTMADAVVVIEEMFRQQGLGNIVNNPRQRVRTKQSMLHYLAGALPHLGVMGYKAYTTHKDGMKFRVFLHDIDSGELLSIMEGNYMGMIRTGAVSGVASKYMAREDTHQVGIYGAGWQARGQLAAMCAVRDIKGIKVFSRDKENRQEFSSNMEELLETEVVPAGSPEQAMEDVDCVITATTAYDPVFSSDWLKPGMHINAIGGNFLFKREISESTVLSADKNVVESIEQCMIEAGEFLPVVEKGRMKWSDLTELGDVVSGKASGRDTPGEITLFKSVGVAIGDLAVAAHIYKIARGARIGTELQIPS